MAFGIRVPNLISTHINYTYIFSLYTATCLTETWKHIRATRLLLEFLVWYSVWMFETSHGGSFHFGAALNVRNVFLAL